MKMLEGRAGVETDGTVGVGRGIAAELAESGAGSLLPVAQSPGAQQVSEITGIRCDHRQDEHVAAAFQQISQKASAIDSLVKNVWDGYEHMPEDGVFTWNKLFAGQLLSRWHAMFSANVRAHYHGSQLAAPAMVSRQRGLVNISFWAARCTWAT